MLISKDKSDCITSVFGDGVPKAGVELPNVGPALKPPSVGNDADDCDENAFEPKIG